MVGSQEKLHFDDTTIEFEASEIGREPLATFIESIVALQEVGKSIFEWNDELNILRFECHLQDEYMLNVSITLENECLESYILRWDFEMEYSMFKQVIVDVVFSAIERYGLEVQKKHPRFRVLTLFMSPVRLSILCVPRCEVLEVIAPRWAIGELVDTVVDSLTRGGIELATTTPHMLHDTIISRTIGIGSEAQSALIETHKARIARVAKEVLPLNALGG